jgi:hypothetical protein
MPKRKTVEADVIAAESEKRAPATKPKAPAATHKRATKKTSDLAALAPTPVRAISSEEIACRAYSYWEARGYQDGSADEDWFRAERELLELSQDR